MSIKNEISEKFSTLSSEKEIRAFLNEIITALHDINNATVSSLVKNGAMADERASNKAAQTDMLLKQIVDNICDNIRIDNLNKKAKAYETIKAEKEALAFKVERAKEMLAEKDVEIEKARKTTRNEIKKKLQIGRDKVIAIAETSTVLGEHIGNAEAIDVLNNIRENIGLLTNEMILLGLWDEDDIKPNVEPIAVKTVQSAAQTTKSTNNEEKPKKKTARKTTKKAPTEPKITQKVPSTDIIESLDELSDEKEATSAVEENSQISMLDETGDNK